MIDRRVLARVEGFGWLVPLGEDRYEAPMPSLLDAAEEVVRRGVPLTPRDRGRRQAPQAVQDRRERVRQALPRGPVEAVR